jgi:hypothetical protein
MPLFKTCRSCATPSTDASWREAHYLVLCSACNADLNSFAEAEEQDAPEPQVSVYVAPPTVTMDCNVCGTDVEVPKGSPEHVHGRAYCRAHSVIRDVRRRVR